MEEAYKKTLKWMFGIFFSFMALVGTVNYVMDSYWTFDHENIFNQMQTGANERQQKTNYIYFHKFDYDSLLLGSSRTTLINQNDFNPPLKVFNYAVSLMMPKEYEPYIDFAKKVKGGEFEYIILALDFFGTNKYENSNVNPERIIKNTTSFLYRWKLLFSIDALRNSIANLRRFITGKKYRRSYNRHNVATTDILDPKFAKKFIERRNYWEKKYAYDENYTNILKNLKKKNPHSKFIVFTTPVSAHMFRLMINEGRIKDYERWLRELVEIFGKVTNFMTENSITNDYAHNYLDSNHFYPRIGTLIAHKVLGRKDPNIPPDFGDVLTKENIDEYIKKLDKKYIEELAKAKQKEIKKKLTLSREEEKSSSI